MDIIKIGILGVTAAFFALLLRKEKPEYSTLISMACCVCIFLYLLTKVELVLGFVKRLENLTAIDSTYIALILKMTGITYVAEFAVNICKDAGYGAIAGQIENFAKIAVFVISLPVFMAFLDTIGSLL